MCLLGGLVWGFFVVQLVAVSMVLFASSGCGACSCCSSVLLPSCCCCSQGAAGWLPGAAFFLGGFHMGVWSFWVGSVNCDLAVTGWFGWFHLGDWSAGGVVHLVVGGVMPVVVLWG